MSQLKYPPYLFHCFRCLSVEELRKELETLKSRGNSALKSGNHNEALRFYNEALEITQNAKELYKEAAILYSNKANVLNKQQKYDEALPNAIAAVSCDETWQKVGKYIVFLVKSYVILCLFKFLYLKELVHEEYRFFSSYNIHSRWFLPQNIIIKDFILSQLQLGCSIFWENVGF